MKKINSVAEALITRFLSKMVSAGIISEKEAAFKKVEVEENRVSFLVSEKLKDLLMAQIVLRKPKFASAHTSKSPVGGWIFTVEDAGAESFFFARQLQRILYRNEGKSDKCRYIGFNKKFIEAVAENSIIKAKKKPSDFPLKSDYEEKLYTFFIDVNGTKINMKNKSVDLISMKIAREIPRIINILLK